VSLTADHLKQPEFVDADVEGRYRFEGLGAIAYEGCGFRVRAEEAAGIEFRRKPEASPGDPRAHVVIAV
jgi:hypothetical protein